MRSAQPTLRRRRLPHLLGIGVSAVALAGLFQLQSVWAQSDVEADEDPMAEELEAEFEAEALEELEELEAMAKPKPEPVVAMAPVMAATAVDAKAVTAATVIAKAEAATEASASADAATETETETEIIPEVVALVAVPDLSGLSLRKARKQLKDAGLKMSARDGSYRIPWQEWGYYKVRKQKTEAGTMVEPGTRVRVKAREKFSYGKGY